MNKNELMFVKKMYDQVFGDDLNLSTLNTLFEHQNRIILRKLTHLGNLNNKRLTRYIVKLFYDNDILGQIAVLISLGDFNLSKTILSFLEKDLKIEDDLFVEIIKTALKNCVYNQDIFEPETKIKLESIWRAVRNISGKKGRILAVKTFEFLRNDDRTNNILKKAIFEAYNNAFT